LIVFCVNAHISRGIMGLQLDVTEPTSSGAQRLSRPFAVMLAILASLVVAALSFAVTVPFFRVIIGDCVPGQQDGQCGLGTFMAYICALGASLIVWLVAAVKFSRRLLGRRKMGPL
jgi:hypothetical protein